MNTDSAIAHKNAYRVCLMGASLDTYNMGVSALAASLRKIIQDIRPAADITLLIGNRSSKGQELQVTQDKKIILKVVNYRLSPRAHIHEHLIWILFLACLQKLVPFKSMKKKIIRSNPFLNAIDSADFIGDVRGGDSFSDIYGLSVLLVGSIPAVIVLLLNKNLTLLPQTYGPYNSIVGRWIAKYILHRAGHLYSRDRESINIVRDLQGSTPKNHVTFCPDVAFLLDPIKLDSVDIQPSLTSHAMSSLIGININGLMYNGGFTRRNMFDLKLDYISFAIKLVKCLLEQTCADILFIPHTFNPPVESDPEASRNIIHSLPDMYKDRVHIVARDYDHSEIKGIIGMCDFFIGSRMHACIGALSQGIPTVGVAYSKKFKGIFGSIGAEEWVIDGQTLDDDMAVDRALACYQNRDVMKSVLQEKIPLAKDQIRRVFEGILA